MSNTNVYSLFYDEMDGNGCENCSCSAVYSPTGEKVEVNARICNHETIDIEIKNSSGSIVYEQKQIDINHQPEDCPITQCESIHCY